VSGSISGKKSERYSPAEWGSWREGDSPKMPWEISSSSRAKKLRSHGRYNPYILRPNTNGEILGVLTAYKSGSMKRSPKSAKFDSEVILVSPNVVVGRRTGRKASRSIPLEILKLEELIGFIASAENHAEGLNLVSGRTLEPRQHQRHREPPGKSGYPGSFT